MATRTAPTVASLTAERTRLEAEVARLTAENRALARRNAELEDSLTFWEDGIEEREAKNLIITGGF